MSFGNEVLTFQFGHYSNFIGAHWFNIQEAGFSFNPNFLPEINNDVLFREGKSRHGDPTYTPRLLFVDYQRSLGHLENAGETLHEITENSILVEEKIENLCESTDYAKNDFLIDLEATKKGEIPVLKNYYDLEDSVFTWTDFLIPLLQERSTNVISNYRLDTNACEFNNFSLGTAQWKEDDFAEDFTDKIRLYMEECDNLQGFQVLVDAHNAFSGLSSCCLEYLKDEYDKKTIFCIPTYDSEYLSCCKNDVQGTFNFYLNSILGMSQFVEFSDIISPVSVCPSLFAEPHIFRTYSNTIYDSKKRYHTSAIIAAALETITSPYRLRASPARMNDMMRDIALNGRKVACVGINIPFPMGKSDMLFDVLNKWDSNWFESLTPEVTLDTSYINSQIVSSRGVSNKCLLDELSIKTVDQNNPAYQCKTVSEMFKLFFNFTFEDIKTLVSSSDTVCRIPSTFPNIFNENYNLSFDIANAWGRLGEVRTLAALHNTAETQNLLQRIVKLSRSKLINKLAENSGNDKTDFIENIERLEQLISCYDNSSWLL